MSVINHALTSYQRQLLTIALVVAEYFWLLDCLKQQQRQQQQKRKKEKKRNAAAPNTHTHIYTHNYVRDHNPKFIH